MKELCSHDTTAPVILTWRMFRTLTAVKLCCLAPSSKVRSSMSSSFRSQDKVLSSWSLPSLFLLVPFFFFRLFSFSSLSCSSANKPRTLPEHQGNRSQNTTQDVSHEKEATCRLSGPGNQRRPGWSSRANGGGGGGTAVTPRIPGAFLLGQTLHTLHTHYFTYSSWQPYEVGTVLSPTVHRKTLRQKD